jgi:septal ring factor EnvC (AmiA/AmiB activator)
MTSTPRRTARFRLGFATLLAATAGATLLPMSSSADQSVGSLSNQLSHEQSRQHQLTGSIGGLSQTIASLDGQISLVRSREAAVRADLVRDRAALARIRVLLVREQKLLAVLRTRLARARMILARQLVSNYEGDRPDLVGVVLNASGFNELLERIDFLRRAEGQQQDTIKVTQADKAAADNAERTDVRTQRRLGDPVLDRAVRIGRPEPVPQQRRRVGLLPDPPEHLEAVRRHRAGGLPGVEVRAGRRREQNLERRRRRPQLGLRRHRRHHLISGGGWPARPASPR